MDRRATAASRQLMRLNANLFDVLYSTEDGETQKVDKVREIITKGGYVNSKLNGQTPLHVAVEYEEAIVVKGLITLGADPNLQDDQQLTPIKLAEKIGNANILACFSTVAVPCFPAHPEKIDFAPLDQKQLPEPTKIYDERPEKSMASKLPPEQKQLPQPTKTGDKKPEKLTASKFPTQHLSYFISRSLTYRIIIKDSVLSILSTLENRDENRISATCDILARNEEQFKQLCQENPNDNIHLLMTTKKGVLVWHKTRGSIDLIAQHVDTEKAFEYSPKLLIKLLDTANRQRTMLIVDQPGMGKSIILTFIAHIIKRRSPLHWVSRININDFCKELDSYKAGEFDEKQLCRKLFNLDTPLEVHFFAKCLSHKRAVLMLDGFDEISPFYKEVAIVFLRYLKSTQIRQLWITSRPHLERELVNVMEQLPLYLKPFSSADQIKFLTRFWQLIILKNIEKPNIKRLQNSANTLIKKLAESLSDADQELTGIPLLTRMLAEAYGKQVKMVEINPKEPFCLPKVLDLFRLFKDFFTQKFDIHNQKSKSIGEERYDIYSVNPMKIHQRLAIELLFPNDCNLLLGGKNSMILGVEAMARFGIVYGDGYKFSFTHRAFAEYLVAVYFAGRLEKNKHCHEANNFFLQRILCLDDYRVIRRFLDDLLDSVPINVSAIEEYGHLLLTLWEEKIDSLIKIVLVRPLNEGNSNILEFLLKCLKSKDANIIKELLSSTKMGPFNCWQKTVVKCFYSTVSTVLKWSKEMNLSVRDMLLENIINGCTVFYVAVVFNNIDVVRLVFDWADRERLNIDELLKIKNQGSNTLWHLIPTTDRFEIFKVFINFIKDKNIDKISIFTIKNNTGNTIWHNVADSGNAEISSTLFEWYPKTIDSVQRLMFDKNIDGRNVWHLAAEKGNIEFLGFLHDVVVEYNMSIVDILRVTDIKGDSVFHVATREDCADAFTFMWKLIPDEHLKRLILILKNYEGDTVWHVSMLRRNSRVVRLLWECVDETSVDISYLLFISNNHKVTILSMLVWSGIASVVNNALTHASNKNVEILSLLKSRDRYGFTPLHTACSRGSHGVFELLLRWSGTAAKELLTEQTLNGEIPLHLAAYNGHRQIFKALRKWIESIDEDPEALLSLADSAGNTVWHHVAMGGDEKLLSVLLVWCQELGNGRRYVLESLRTLNKNGDTPWLCATARGYIKIMTLLMKKGNIDLRKLLMQRSACDRYAWHLCAGKGDEDALLALLAWCRDAKLDFSLVINSKDSEGDTLIHLAAMRGHARAMESILQTVAKEDRGLDAVFVNRNNAGGTVFLCAFKFVHMLKLLWSWLHRTQLDLCDVLLTRNVQGFTVWHLVSSNVNETRDYDFLWECADEVHIPVQSVLLDVENVSQATPLHFAAFSGNDSAFLSIWDRAKAVGVLDRCLEIRDYNGDSISHFTARSGSLKTLRMLRNRVVDAGGTLRDFLKPTNNSGHTVFHSVCDFEYEQRIQEVCEWVFAESDDLTLAVDLINWRNGLSDTALNIVAYANKPQHVDLVMQWAMDAGCDLCELLTSSNAAGDNVWFVAVRGHSVLALQALRLWVAVIPQMDMKIVLGLTNTAGQSLLTAAKVQADLNVLETIYRWMVDEGIAPAIHPQTPGGRIDGYLFAKQLAELACVTGVGKDEVLEQVMEYGGTLLPPLECQPPA